MENLYNMRSPAVRRLMKEAQELSTPTEEYFAQPVEPKAHNVMVGREALQVWQVLVPLTDNLFEWHFTVRGPPESEFDGGVYHGRIILPPEYPMKPPSIILLTPNGRFEVSKKICLSISGHHPESWQPSWSIRTALLALIGFMPTHGGGAIGSLDYNHEERKTLAKRSKSWICNACGGIASLINDRSESPESVATRQEAKELASQISFKGEIQGPDSKTETPAPASTPLTSNSSPQPTPVSPPTRAVHVPQQQQEEQMEGLPSQGSVWTAAIWVLTLAIAVLLLRRVLLL